MNIVAYHHVDEGRTWLRVEPESGYAWDEPMDGWVLILDICAGRGYYRHTDGREYPLA